MIVLVLAIIMVVLCRPTMVYLLKNEHLKQQHSEQLSLDFVIVLENIVKKA